MKLTIACYGLFAFGGMIAIAPDLMAATTTQHQTAPAAPTAVKISQNLVNFESELLKLTNLERKKLGLAALRRSPQLAQAAQSHAVDMAKNNYFSHRGLNGSSMADRVKRSGYAYSTIGENIAAGKATPEGTIRQWMNSPGHRANILNSKFTEIGFGYANAPNSPYRHYWVQLFGKPHR
jgi:uncharacterized protein YkwD